MALPGIRWQLNGRCDRALAYGRRQRAAMCRQSRRAARETVCAWPGYRPTPLMELPGLAARLGIARLRVKHEGWRFGLKSFKALGGAYGVMRALERRTGAPLADIVAGRAKERVAGATVACATDGNHGRAVAWGARLAGAGAAIYLHEGVSGGREDAIAAFGARIVRTKGSYDDSVRQAAADARAGGWIVVADTSWPGYERIPAWVMQGYTVAMAEAMERMGAQRPSHLLVQAGVGGLAAAMIAPLWEEWGTGRPFCVVVEPHEADCVWQSAAKGRPSPARGSLQTAMACLSAGEVSPLAWAVLAEGADAFATVADRFALAAMRALAAGEGGDPPLAAGESGAAGIACLMAAGEDGEARRALRLGSGADVLAIVSEGATDPAIYEEIVGRPPAAVEAVP